MKFASSSVLGLTLATAALAAPATTPTILPAGAPQPAPRYPIGKSGGSNAKVAGRLFEMDGKVEYFAGTNAWWLAHLSRDSDVDIAMAEIAKTNYKILRVWAFGDVNTPPPATNTDPNKVYFHILNSTGTYINYGHDGLERLDYVVSSAEKHKIKLVLPFVNNWGDYGGIAAYTAAFGNTATSFYTDAKAQAAYRLYIQTIVSRYQSSPAIFAWELGNEPRCHTCDTSVITNWATSTSEYIKSLDPGHLVTLGDEGWLAPADGVGDGSYAYSGYEGVDWVANMKIKTLDYGTVHLYPNSWGYADYSWGSTWIQQHDVLGKALGKPVILEEYGTPFPHNHTGTEGPWQQTVLQSGLAADQIWQFGSNRLSVPATSLSDVNTIFHNDTEYTVLARQHAAQMLAKPI